jgi:hypothetical protein
VTSFDDDESYALFLILDSLARMERGTNKAVLHFRELLLPVYSEWHQANPGKVHSELDVDRPRVPAQRTPAKGCWTPEQGWEYVEGLTDIHTRDMMRDMLASKGLLLTSTESGSGE